MGAGVADQTSERSATLRGLTEAGRAAALHADALRLLAPIGYVPPVEREEQYYRSQEAPATVG